MDALLEASRNFVLAIQKQKRLIGTTNWDMPELGDYLHWREEANLWFEELEIAVWKASVKDGTALMHTGCWEPVGLERTSADSAVRRLGGPRCLHQATHRRREESNVGCNIHPSFPEGDQADLPY